VGARPAEVIRVVLDTNTLIPAFLFPGTASRLVSLWQSRRITVAISKDTLEEYLRVLAYPRLRLSDEEIRGLVEEELLPFVETIRGRRRLAVVRRDPEDDKFIECGVASRARYLVTGDRDLREIQSYRGITILTVGEFLERTNL
jgi:putative PIN family toxin of toxin-antitoxin system